MTPGSIFEDGAPKGASAYDVWKHDHAQELARPRKVVAYPVDQDHDGCIAPGMSLVDDKGLPYVYAEPDIGVVYYLTIDPAGPRDCNPAWRNRGLSATLRAFNRR